MAHSARFGETLRTHWQDWQGLIYTKRNIGSYYPREMGAGNQEEVESMTESIKGPNVEEGLHVSIKAAPKASHSWNRIRVGSTIVLKTILNNIGKQDFPGGFLNYEIKWMNGLGGRGQLIVPPIPSMSHAVIDATQHAEFTGDGIVSVLVVHDSSGTQWPLFFGSSFSPPKGTGVLDGFPFTVEPKINWVAWGTLLAAVATLVVSVFILWLSYYK